MEALIEILNIPYLWQSLGVITGLSMFISPIFYNGDYKIATKSATAVGGYMFFVGMMNYFHLCFTNNYDIQLWLQSIMLLVLVGLAYVLGLFIGVSIYKYIHRGNQK